MLAKRELLESLREQVRRIETAQRRDSSTISLGCSGLDALLPQRGITRGSIHEWLTPHEQGWPAGGNGAEILSLIAAREACRAGGGLVVIDPAGCFYPPAAASWGIALENTIVLRPESRRDALWAIEQSLRCTSVAAVWGFLDRTDERWLRRFQLSAEQSGCVGLFVRPASTARRATWADSQWLCRGWVRAMHSPSSSSIPSRSSILSPSSSIPSPSWGGPGRGASLDLHDPPTPSESSSIITPCSLPSSIASESPSDRWLQVRLARIRGGVAGVRLFLRIDFQTGDVHLTRNDSETNRVRLSRQLAHPAVGRRAARA